MAISLAQAKSLCTENEFALVSTSTRNEIGKLSAAELRLKILRARNSRDKWRDQADRQRRATQTAQLSRQTSANARSAAKGELFGEVLGRFEKQLSMLEAEGATTGAAPKRVARRARSATHRATRAVMRDELKEARLELGGRKKPVMPKAFKQKAAPAPPPVAESTAEEEPPKGKKAARPMLLTSKVGRGKVTHGGVGMNPIEAARALQGLRVTKGNQRRATTAAKQDRLKAAGIVRIQKNASARNKRRQGKRDARSV